MGFWHGPSAAYPVAPSRESNNKIKSISHRPFVFRTAEHFIAAIYRCYARLPLPVER
jgi:hypothetical protein